MGGCLACDVISGSVVAPGGRILETEHWVVDHGPRLQAAMFARGELPDPTAAATFADRARSLLA